MTGFDPIAFLEDAVAIPSHEGVGPMRDLLVETLREHGVEPTVDSAGNVLASRGDGDSESDEAGPHVVLNTHIDTVSPHVPFERDGGTIRGRGSCDAKGPLSAMLAAFLAIDLDPASPGTGRLTLAVTPDEETYSRGAAALDLDLDGDRGDCVIVGEPTGLDVCTAAKGRFEGTISIAGERAHAAEPHTGRNAVSGAATVLDALEAFDDAERERSESDTETGSNARDETEDRSATPGGQAGLGAPTLTPTTIRGGAATNQVPADCEIVVDRRSVPPETSAGFAGALESHLKAAVADAGRDVDVTFQLTERETPFLEAFETPADTSVVRALAEAAGRTDGASESGGAVRPFTAATEASYFARQAPTVVFGPGVLADAEGPVAHAEREYVRVRDVEAAADALEAALRVLVRGDDASGADGASRPE